MIYENVTFARRGVSGEEEDDEPDYDDEQYWSPGREASLVPDSDPLECAGSGLVEPHRPEFTVSAFAVHRLSRFAFITCGRVEGNSHTVTPTTSS